MKTDNNRVELYDTTLRDGTQAKGITLSLHDKLTAARMFDDLGVDYIEGGYPLSNPKDEQFFQEMRKVKLSNARLAAFGMTRRKATKPADDAGMNALLHSEAPVITIVGKTWDMHVSEVLSISEQENLDMIADSIGFMADAGRFAIYDAEHFFDGFKANPQYALKTLAAALQAGAQRLVLCDTNGGSMPEEISSAIAAVLAAMPEAKLGIHCHNDCDLAVANSLAAVNARAVQVQGTINGVGERCGNADLVSIAANLALKYGRSVLKKDSLAKLTEVSRNFYELANMNFRDNQSYVGSNAFAHKGGMHVHAVQKISSSYEHVAPETVGNTRRILVSELSGVSNIAATVPAKFKLEKDRDAQKKILARIVELENEGYEFERAEASFEMIVRETLGGKWHSPLWKLDHYRCIILKRDSEDATTEATVKLKFDDGSTVHTVREGDGPVDSLAGALKDALRKRYIGLDNMHLMDYRVCVVNTAAETAAKVRVVIDWRSGDRYFGSVGVGENIIDASWRAMVDAIEYKLLNDKESAN